ncbi:MAG: multicopper oxidase family protein [Candidatus Binataceae bacterium]
MRLLNGLPKMQDFARKSLLIPLIGSFSCLMAGCSGGSSGPAPTPPVSSFPQPQVRRSSGGKLQTTLHAVVAENMMVDGFSGEHRVINTPTYEGSIPGPTLSVKPGDKLLIDLVNDLPANPTTQRGGAFPHDPYTTNFHTHGLEVSPLGNGDNIFRQMLPGGTHNPIEIDIPADHPSGTYWYHPHKHGAVTTQLVAGMAGFLIVRGGPGTLDAVPEVAAAKDIVMGFQVIRSLTDGSYGFVDQLSQQFGTFPFFNTDPVQQGPWSTYGLDGAPGRSFYYYTTNGMTNPTLHMRPGEVQRWRLLNATDSDNLLISLKGHALNIVAMDGITVANQYHLQTEQPVVMSAGSRFDVMVKAGAPGTYQLAALIPTTPASVSPSPQNIAPEPRMSQHSFDFPTPCSTDQASLLPPPCNVPQDSLAYPVPLVSVVIDGKPTDMKLPPDNLPPPAGLPSVATMLNRTPDVVRNLAFEICANKNGTSMEDPSHRLPSCGWYFNKYDATYWGGAPFNNLEMLRDDDDKGTPSVPLDPMMPLVDFQKDGLFNPDEPLFDNMIAGNYEEWTVTNRSFSDHPFHIHQNPFLVTKINGITLTPPEWHDTFIVPAALPMPTGPDLPQPNVNTNFQPSITFRTYFNPITVGCFVAHCHIITHEDLGMMQRLDILPAAGQPSGCGVNP